MNPEGQNATPQVLIGIVHNHNPDRLGQIREVAAGLAENFSQAGIRAEIVEAHFSPDLFGRQTLSDVVAHAAWNWVPAVFTARLNRPRRIWRLLSRVSRALVIWARRGHRDQELSVKRSIAGKHLHLMETALNREAKFLMILEDDAVPNEFGKQEFSSLIPPMLQLLGSNERWYLNLGGESQDQLIASLSSSAEPYAPGFVRLMPQQVDTVCAFVISRPVVEEIMKTILFRPELRASSPDHLMNYLMQKKSIACIHASPALFIHGSTTSLGSWH